MIEIVYALLAAGVIMGVLDFLWLGVIAKKLYYSEMGAILLKKPNMVAALIFYVVYVVGVVLLVVLPALAQNSLEAAVYNGALLGLFAYATYDLTNLATLKGFSSKVVIVDLLWGTFITTVVCAGSYIAASTL